MTSVQVRVRGIRRTPMPVSCDESGICELVNGLKNDPKSIDRCFDNGADWALVVDISPVVVGHCLILPYAHRIRLSDSSRRWFGRIGKRVDLAVKQLRSVAGTPVIALEHGTAESSIFSCVRHVHMHVVPVAEKMDKVSQIVSHLDSYLEDVRVCYTWNEAYREASKRDGYIMLRASDGIIVASERGSRRQIARVLIHELNLLGTDEADWALRAGGDLYHRSIQLLGKTVGSATQ